MSTHKITMVDNRGRQGMMGRRLADWTGNIPPFKNGKGKRPKLTLTAWDAEIIKK
jgi:hypothetical protein